MSSPSPFLFSPPPLQTTCTAASPDLLNGSSPVDAVASNMLATYAADTDDLETILRAFDDAGPLQEPTVAKHEVEVAPNASAEQVPPSPVRPTKPAKQIPTISFPAPAFYIDPMLSLPTPVDDKGPPALDMSAYMRTNVHKRPELSLPTPTKDNDQPIKMVAQQPGPDGVLAGICADLFNGTKQSISAGSALDLSILAMSRSSTNASTDSSTSSCTAVDQSLAGMSEPKMLVSSPVEDIALFQPGPTSGEATAPQPLALVPGFPSHLPLSYPAKSGVTILNAKSEPVGWDCGPATLSMYELKYGAPAAHLNRDVQSHVLGGAPPMSVNWRLYGDGRFGTKRMQETVKTEPVDINMLAAPSSSNIRKIAPRKSPSRPAAPGKPEPSEDEAKDMWMRYFVAFQQFRLLGLPSVMGPWEPECKCPFAEKTEG